MSLHISFFFLSVFAMSWERGCRIRSYFAHTFKTRTGVFRSFFMPKQFFFFLLYLFPLPIFHSLPLLYSFLSNSTVSTFFFPPLSRATSSSPALPPSSPLPHFCPAQVATPTHMVHITYEEKVSEISLTIIKHYTYYSLRVHTYTARCWSLFPACII